MPSPLFPSFEKGWGTSHTLGTAPITLERSLILEHPPQRHVRNKLESRSDGTAAINFEWIALGWNCREFLDRVVALDHDAGKPVEVEGGQGKL